MSLTSSTINTRRSTSLLWHAVYQRSRCVCASAATREWLTVAGLFTEVGGRKAPWAVKMCFSGRPTRPPLIPHQRLFGTSRLIFDFAFNRMDGHVSTGDKYNIYCRCHCYGFICVYIYIWNDIYDIYLFNFYGFFYLHFAVSGVDAYMSAGEKWYNAFLKFHMFVFVILHLNSADITDTCL